ncbi:hypothetical protein BX659_12611 [Orenia metallireducens]|uniref:Uncharacterized protein n=1 Tax=Orenia metallireducens TaxID=1413210 RepID=A0A285I1U1_9FIRM|nr:hypothetical protein [Orenia metallireducens]PRX23232.1 hypothetical protein BX659_12611 [Orenia metallireducens]SNY41942.1 hypothetical protein SAMN06265827_12911 [Orenia metallireducens]
MFGEAYRRKLCQVACYEYGVFYERFKKIKDSINLGEEFEEQFTDLEFSMKHLYSVLSKENHHDNKDCVDSKRTRFKYSLQEQVMVNFTDRGLQKAIISKLGLDESAIYYKVTLKTYNQKNVECKVPQEWVEDYLISGIDFESLSSLYYEEGTVNPIKFMANHSQKKIYKLIRGLKNICNNLS